MALLNIKPSPLGLIVIVSLLMSAIASTALPVSSLAQQAIAKDNVVRLNQGWSDDDRLRYYYTSQGSAALPYDLFLNLEQATSSELFRSDQVTAAFGLIPQPADPKYNPNGLPIGFARTKVPAGRWKGEWVGLTCAACHNLELHYKGAKINIEGASGNSFNFQAYIQALDDALAATAANSEKFDRLAIRLNRRDSADKTALKSQLELVASQVHYYRNVTMLTPFPWGPGRLDTLGLIHNRVGADVMQIPENSVVPLAPVKPPFLWNAPQSSWVQWTGVAADPLRRNAIESMGIFIAADLHSKTPADGLFDSTMDLKGQIEIEELLRRLAPPKWPEQFFGAIDRQKAADGARLFVENCAECHSTWPHRWSEPKLKGKMFIENALVPLDVVGTDPMQFHSPQFDTNPSTITGALSPYLDPPFKDAVLAPYGAVNKAATTNLIAKALAKLGLTQDQLADASGFRTPQEKGPPQPVYKAGPCDGVWAIGPFLHNGSVPNLYELLVPAGDRSKTFFLGRDFDPVKVGIDTSGNSGRLVFDTSLVGNSNKGHSFQDGPRVKGVIGRLLTEDERWALIEYLKSIPSADAEITPYGGPNNPIMAGEDPTFFHNRHKTGYDGK